MAAIATKNLGSFKIYVNKGLDDEGKEMKATRTYSKVDPGATPQNVYDVANAIGAIQKHEVEKIEKIDDSTLSEL